MGEGFSYLDYKICNNEGVRLLVKGGVWNSTIGDVLPVKTRLNDNVKPNRGDVPHSVPNRMSINTRVSGKSTTDSLVGPLSLFVGSGSQE